MSKIVLPGNEHVWNQKNMVYIIGILGRFVLAATSGESCQTPAPKLQILRDDQN